MIEVLVAVVITVLVVVAMAALFDRSAKLSKVENSVTDAQQNVRYGIYQLVRELRMAGAGGLPSNPDATISLATSRQFPVSLNLGSTTYGTGAAFRVNNVGGGTPMVLGGTHYVRSGTDVIHVRGIMDGEIYDLSGGNWNPVGGGAITSGTLTIVNCSKYPDPLNPPKLAACLGYAANDMSYFTALPATWSDRIFVMKDASGVIGAGVVNVAPNVPAPVGGLTTATLSLDTTNSYVQSLNPGGAFPPQLTTPVRGGFLDDRVYFIDNGTVANATCGPANAALSPGPCHPVLSVAEWQTGDSTAAPYSTATVTQIAEDVEDMQVAYGMDFYDLTNPACASAGNCTLTNPAPMVGSNSYSSDGSISILNKTTFDGIIAGTTTNTDPSEDASGPGLDEWIGNAAGELTSGGTYATDFTETLDLSRLRAMEISLLAKGTQPDPKYTGLGAMTWPLMDSQDATVSSQNGYPYHRRVQIIRVSLRNLKFGQE